MFRFRGSSILFYVFVSGLVMPAEAIVVPLYFEFRDIQLTDTYWSMILPEAGLYLAFGSFWMRAFFRSVPRSLVDASRIDGASSWTLLWRVLFPLARPSIVTMLLLFFLWSWNEFLLPLVMTSSNPNLQTLPVGLAFFQGERTTDFSGLAAGALLVIGPVVLLYIVLHRQFARGMLSGAVKG
jgi:raffinose/stachyose/melibiose transport system permease protein